MLVKVFSVRTFLYEFDVHTVVCYPVITYAFLHDAFLAWAN